MKHDLVTLVVIMILKDTATFKVLFIVSLFVLGTSLLGSTVALTYLEVKSAKCLCLFPVVLVLVWSRHFGLGLGRKKLVLFTSLSICLRVWPLGWRLVGHAASLTIATDRRTPNPAELVQN